MEVVGATLSPVAAVHVLGLGHGPLAVVERLLRAGHHLAEQRAEGAGPLDSTVRQERRGLGQAAAVHRRDDVIHHLGHQHHGRPLQTVSPGALEAPR